MTRTRRCAVQNVLRDKKDLTYPTDLREKEEALIAKRRAAASIPQSGPLTSENAVGVAISGGGIRSATFALGVFKVLARKRLVRCIDFLSTVSGGGYFGGFLGRLFTRDYVRPPESASGAAPSATALAEHAIDRVEQVLAEAEGSFDYGRAGEESGGSSTQPKTIWKRGPVEQLRSNGRYLAPKGGGDFLTAGAILLRNWVALHAVILTTLVTIFMAPRILESWSRAHGVLDACSRAAAVYLSKEKCSTTDLCASIGEWLHRLFCGGGTPACSSLDLLLEGAMLPLLLAGLVLAVAVIPRLWGYWLLAAEREKNGLPPAGIDIQTMIPGFVLLVAAAVVARALQGGAWSVAATVATFVGVEALLAMAAALGAKCHAMESDDTKTDPLRRGRAWLSRRLVSGLLVMAVLLVAAIVGAVGHLVWACGSGYAIKRLAAVLGGTGALAAFSKQIVIQFSSGKRGERPGASLSVIAYVGAALWVLILLLTADVLSRAAGGTPSCLDGAASRLADFAWVRPGLAFLSGAILCLLLGMKSQFLNLSSQHNFYSQRLTRAYLGASNPARIYGSVRLSDAIASDDARLDEYWQTGLGAPLHFINTTINETLDGASAIQYLDRKGLPLVVGPCGLTAGKRHHYVTDWRTHFDAAPAAGAGTKPPATAYAPHASSDAKETPGMFSVFDQGFDPELLTIGQWISVSGAAFSTGLGARTNVGLSLLCGLANVRLGYWWDTHHERASVHWTTRLARSGFMVQSYLLNELLARFPGTAWRRWYLSDGGHFENMGGYELIRRKVRCIVIADGEADGDYAFEGLGNLVRLARVDFDADVRFLTETELDGLVEPHHRRAFGSLDHLRRGEWKELGHAKEAECGRGEARLEEADPTKHSLAHAALAEVTYADDSKGWLIYLKTTLSGREPVDVTYYHRAHEEFPHESTADQFFDELQWESYRRLGEHVAELVFGDGEKVDRAAPDDRPSDRGGTWLPRELFHGHGPPPAAKTP